MGARLDCWRWAETKVHNPLRTVRLERGKDEPHKVAIAAMTTAILGDGSLVLRGTIVNRTNILIVKIAIHIYCAYCRSYIIWSPVIVTVPETQLESEESYSTGMMPPPTLVGAHLAPMRSTTSHHKSYRCLGRYIVSPVR